MGSIVRPRRRLLQAVFCGALALSVGVVAAGCGSGSAESTSSTTSTSDAVALTFSKRASAICNSYSDRITALGKAKPGLAGIPPYVSRALPIIISTFDRLSMLTPPDYSVTTTRKWLATYKVLISELRLMSAAATRGNRREVDRIRVVIARNNSKGRAWAQLLGLNDCAG